MTALITISGGVPDVEYGDDVIVIDYNDVADDQNYALDAIERLIRSDLPAEVIDRVTATIQEFWGGELSSND